MRCTTLRERRVLRQVLAAVQGRSEVKKKEGKRLKVQPFFSVIFFIFHISRITHLAQGHLVKGFAVLTIEIATNDTLEGTSHPI